MTPKKKKAESEQEVLSLKSSYQRVVVLPSRDFVPFPAITMSLFVTTPKSKNVVKQLKENDLVFVVCQKNGDHEEAGVDDLYSMGVISRIVRVLNSADGKQKVLLNGLVRARAEKYHDNGALSADIEIFPEGDVKVGRKDREALTRIRSNLQLLVEYEHLPEELLLVSEGVEHPGALADMIAAHYRLEMNYAQSLLEELDPLKRLHLTDKIVNDDLNSHAILEGIKDRTRDELSKGQREYYLKEQLKQIRKELGETDDASEDLTVLKEKIAKAGLSPEAQEEANRQMRRLERMHTESSEYSLLRTYLEWLSDLPWSVSTKDNMSIQHARKILNDEHFGLEKAKDKILEFLSVKKLNPDSRGAILCFVGPPGVGKTSLGRSIAKSLERKFFRLSLGGIRDEAEIRGHRRTYVGALPGKIVQGLKEAGSRNPVFVLDELDKVGADFRGDPAAALLEVLDPEQNKDFRDHYLSLPFDLSQVLFIATANTTDTIPPALLDRLELVYISGYTIQEKHHISKQHLIPRQLEQKGLLWSKIKIADSALTFLIERYTSESGVRNLSREIGSLFSKLARRKVERGKLPKTVTVDVVKELLGNTKNDPESAMPEDSVGIVQGLAWTIHGGELMLVEASVAAGDGKLTLTGQLGSVMQESAQASMFYVRSNAARFGLEPDFHKKYDIHIHLPAGATPKDGPSAGITIVTALLSALTGRKVYKNVAMTGEVTLRGKVLQIGGLKEKALAALRYGIKRIVIPRDNMKDVQDIPADQRKQIEFIPVDHMEDVLAVTLHPVRGAEKPLRHKGGPILKKGA